MIGFLDVKGKLGSGEVKALCLFGNDRWVIRRTVQNVRAFYSATDEFSADVLTQPTVGDIEAACLTPSMFCPTKVVVVQDFVLAPGNKGEEAKNKLSRLISACDGTYFLIIIADDYKPFASLGAEIVDCNRQDKAIVIKWIVATCRRAGMEVDRLSADKLATYCLCDMARVESETQKLIDFGKLDIDSVESMVTKDAEYAVFDLSDAISSKNAAKALDIYKTLRSGGEEARFLFSLLYGTYRRMYYVKTSDFSSEEIAKFLGVKPGAVRFAKETAAKYKPMQLKRALDCFGVAEQKLKAFVNDDEVLTMLILQLTAI